MPELSATKSSSRRLSPPRKSYESSSRSSRPSGKSVTGGSNSRAADTRRPVRRSSSSRSPPRRRRRRSSSTSSDSSATSDSSSSSSSSAGSRESPKHKENVKRQSKIDSKTAASRPRPPPPPRPTGASAKLQTDTIASKQTETANPAGGTSKTSGARDSKRTATSQSDGSSSLKSTSVAGSRPAADQSTERQQPPSSASNGSCGGPADKVTAGAVTRESQPTVKVAGPKDQSPLESGKRAVNKPDVNIPRDDEGEKKKSNANISTTLHSSSTPNLDSLKGSRQIVAEKLTKNVTKLHVTEIFSVWGTIQSVDMPSDRLHPEFSRGYAYITYEDAKSAADAVHYMNGGQIDGEAVRVTEVAMRETAMTGARHQLPGDMAEQRRPLQRDEVTNRRDAKRAFNEDDRHRRRRREGSTSPRHRNDRRRPDADPYHQRERDRRHGDVRRGARRGSSGSPFASRTAAERRRSSPAAGTRAGSGGARYRRPSPPGNAVANARSGDAARRRRHSRSRSPLKASEKTAVARAGDGPRANAGGKRTGAGGKRRSSSSSSSGSSSSGTSSSSRSGSSSSAASSSSSSSSSSAARSGS